MHELILAKSDKTILLTGPTGTGKSRKARALHEQSERSKFLHVNICNFSQNLFESELFGHSKGSFTGAHMNKVGFLEAIGDGTLFLDEIGDLALEAQSKLLMLLEERIYYPVGSTKEKVFRGRLIFATHRNLEEMVGQGLFRKDLWHRIKAFQIELEPLCQHINLLEILEKEFVSSKKSLNNENLLMGEELRLRLMNYDWPGNYRELKSTMDYICLFSKFVADENSLPGYFLKQLDEKAEGVGKYRRELEKFEKQYLIKMLAQRDYRINKTSREIEISKVTLLSKMKKYDIKGKRKILEKAI